MRDSVVIVEMYSCMEIIIALETGGCQLLEITAVERRFWNVYCLFGILRAV
jgi:hypothetical protein